MCSRDSFPIKGDDSISDGYRQLLGLLSHEYFHLWNVKRLRPAVFKPYSLESESYTSLLWVFEGITSYYDDLALVRSGVISEESYFELLGQTVTRVLVGEGRKRQSVAESSFDAWTKFYKQDANATNSIVSYYAKGSLVALALDLTLRSKTETTLDAVLHECFKRFGESGMPEDGFETVCSELAGVAMDDFFKAYVHGTEDPPLEELLQSVGVDLSLRQPAQLADKGGKPSEKKLPIEFGAKVADKNGRTVIQSVANGGAAELAGLAPDDNLIAVEGLRVTASSLERRLRDFAVGDAVELSYFRDDVLLKTNMQLVASDERVAYLVASGNKPETRKDWLSPAS